MSAPAIPLARFSEETSEGRLIRRYKRFLADVELPGGRTLTVHCANSGSMAGCKEPGAAVLLTKSANPNRKLTHSWELVRVGRTWVCINTARPNAMVAQAVEKGAIEELSGYGSLRREVPYGKNSRIDLLLQEGGRRCYVEVKNVTLAHSGRALFPDAVTERGQKHLRELMGEVKKGHRAVAFFLVNRSDCRSMGPADQVDPDYGRLLRQAATSGVEILAYRARWTKKGAWLDGRVPIDLTENP